MNVRVVPMEERHVDAVVALADALNREDGEADHGVTRDVLLADFVGTGRAGTVLVAEIEGTPIGYATLHPAYEPTAATRCLYLGDLYVAPGFRRRGAGRALMAHAAREAASSPGALLLWHAKADNDEGQAFYARLGAVALPVVEWALGGEALERLASVA